MSVLVARIGLDWGTSQVRYVLAQDESHHEEDQEKLYASFLASLPARRARRIVQKRFRELYTSGLIADQQVFADYLRFFLRHTGVQVLPFTRLEIIVALPSVTPQTTKTVFLHALEDIGVSRVIFCSSPLAAAIGAGFAYPFSQFSLLLHLGESSSELAGLSFQECVFSTELHFSGQSAKKLIGSFFFSRFGVQLSFADLTVLWGAIGKQITGVGSLADLPESVQAMSGEVGIAECRTLFSEMVELLVLEIESCLESLSVEEIALITQSGILVTGGGAVHSDLLRYVSGRIAIPLYAAVQSQSCVVRGVQTLLARIDEITI